MDDNPTVFDAVANRAEVFDIAYARVRSKDWHGTPSIDEVLDLAKFLLGE
ncbi:hypothetical protein LHJ74_30765 [Streptomyces sp. N2-109]|uniref:Uncharacterized protein n=1 Tax=Streptomyces gossypii TaxID=2883101 RepID=A0ABT2K246_9ACTN|nr:hypothetical protein [Streptomyces gossypii]MCT2594239.1 hypothetical protein [Streptomyces gossypii]